MHIVDRHQHDTVFIFTVARLGIVPSIEEPEDFTKTCITRNDFLYLLLFTWNKGRDQCLFSKSSLTWGIQRKCDLCTQYSSYRKDKQYSIITPFEHPILGGKYAFHGHPSMNACLGILRLNHRILKFSSSKQ